MELYESLFIIRPSLSDEETTALIEKMKSAVTKNGGLLAALKKPTAAAATAIPTFSFHARLRLLRLFIFI